MVHFLPWILVVLVMGCSQAHLQLFVQDSSSLVATLELEEFVAVIKNDLMIVFVSIPPLQRKAFAKI